MFNRIINLEKIIKLLIQQLQNPNNEYLIQILEILKENEKVNKNILDEDQTPYPLTEEQILTQQLLDNLQQSILQNK
jgi:hypothetical protein